MPDDRRSSRRARLSGLRVTYESTTGDQKTADVTDLSREGIFIEAGTPLAVGKRLSLELQLTGEPAPWSALGRVVWVRETSEGEDAPAGMAVKIIDADDAVQAAIERLIETRERTDPGLGEGGWGAAKAAPVRPNIPARERTMLGVGIEAAPARPAPVVLAAPGREATLLGVGISDTDADDREPSLAIDLVQKPASTRAPSSAPPPAVVAIEAPAAPASPAPSPSLPATPPTAANLSPSTPPPQAHLPPPTRPVRGRTERISEESLSPPPRSARAGWLLVFVLVAACGGAGYAFRARLLPVLHHAIETVTKRLG
jgi:uncharacterized protein (TIGR02266 family)